MSSYVALTISDPRRRIVVASRYIGGNKVAGALHSIMGREPDYIDQGFKSWGNLTPDEMGEIIRLRYSDALSPDRLAGLILRFPPGEYLWSITDDY